MATVPYLAIRSHSIILSPNTDICAATILVDRRIGKVVSITSFDEQIKVDGDLEEWIIDNGCVVMPGLVDAHVHLNEPGRTEWEGFETGTKAAAAGGFTTVIDMPLNSIPPTTTVANLEAKLVAARGQCYVDVGFWGGVIPGNEKDLKPLIEKGVRGFKCFLIESGVEEFPCVVENDVRKALAQLKDTNSILLFHAEMESPTPASTSITSQDPTLYTTFLNSRPETLETRAIDLVISLTREYTPVNTHIVHLSAGSALPSIRAAKQEGLRMTVETTHHYLCLSADEVGPGQTLFKCCPPIREAANRDVLWEALKEGVIDYVVSDHSPCIAELKKMGNGADKNGDFMKAWGGIAGVQFGLSALWTEGRDRGISLQDLTRWLSYNPAKRVNLLGRKGEIVVNGDADFVIWKPEETFTITPSNTHFKNKLTPYDGKKMYGVVQKTIVRGKVVYENGKGFSSEPRGELIL